MGYGPGVPNVGGFEFLIVVVFNLLALAVVLGGIYFVVRFAIRKELDRARIADDMARQAPEPGTRDEE